MKNSNYFNQVTFMVQLLPYVAQEKCFALKGGTAINLFVRNLPRISVDIDLVYLPLQSREETLEKIYSALVRIEKSIQKAFPDARVNTTGGQSPKIYATKDDFLIKIEPNTILRGYVYPLVEMQLAEKAEALFNMSVKMQIASFADLYGGKICAALDRQHPRDLFDVKILLDNEGITEQVRKAFVVYLASHDRAMHDLLNPNLKDFKKVFDTEFSGMDTEKTSCKDLVDVQNKLPKLILSSLTDNEKNFLLSIKQGEPKWELLEIDGLEKLPAIQWKLMNIRKMKKSKKKEAVDRLKKVLEL